MATQSKISFLDYVQRGLRDDALTALEERLVDEAMCRFEMQYRKVVREKLSAIVFDRIETVRDHLAIQEQLKIFLMIDGEEFTP